MEWTPQPLFQLDNKIYCTSKSMFKMFANTAIITRLNMLILTPTTDLIVSLCLHYTSTIVVINSLFVLCLSKRT